MVFFDINSLVGSTLDPGSVSYHFYSFGFSGVSLQYANVSGTELTTAYGQLSGSPVASLDGTTGWRAYDVTSLLQSSIDTNHRYVALVFNATTNYGGGSLAAVDDSANRGSYLTTPGGDAVPEPTTLALGSFGLVSVWILRRRRRA